MKKRTMTLFLVSALMLLLVTACGRASATPNGSASLPADSASGSMAPSVSPETIASTEATSAETETPSAAPSESATAEALPTAADMPSATAEASAGASSGADSVPPFTNERLAAGMNEVDSYRRIIKTTGTSEGSDPFVTIYTYSTVRNPYADHFSLEFPPSSSYAEDMVIGETMYTRMEKEGTWEKYGPGEWQREKPLAFSYDLQAAKYDIDYQKLSWLNMGNETVNGMVCIHYQVSGTFDGEYEPNPDMGKYPVTMMVSGDIWVVEAGPALIRQRLLLKTDVTGTDGRHAKEETVVEDDTLDINSTVIEAPIK